MAVLGNVTETRVFACELFRDHSLWSFKLSFEFSNCGGSWGYYGGSGCEYISCPKQDDETCRS